MKNPISDNQIPGMMKAGLDRFIKAQKGQRLDKRSVTAGYYAAAAIFASAMGKDEATVDLFVACGTDAIDRKAVQS